MTCKVNFKLSPYSSSSKLKHIYHSFYSCDFLFGISVTPDIKQRVVSNRTTVLRALSELYYMHYHVEQYYPIELSVMKWLLCNAGLIMVVTGYKLLMSNLNVASVMEKVNFQVLFIDSHEADNNCIECSFYKTLSCWGTHNLFYSNVMFHQISS